MFVLMTASYFLRMAIRTQARRATCRLRRTYRVGGTRWTVRTDDVQINLRFIFTGAIPDLIGSRYCTSAADLVGWSS